MGSKCNTIDETAANIEKGINSVIKLSDWDWSSPVKETIIDDQINSNKAIKSKEDNNSAINSYKIVKQSTERTNNKWKYVDTKNGLQNDMLNFMSK